MAKPPESTPHSDIDGVREDQHRVVDRAVKTGQDSGDLKRAKEDSIARPRYSDDDGKSGSSDNAS
ncbi:MAG: hypothetical protein M3Q15_07060 [Pseudomonadota bacterium]|nr:hypothetical protein [Pseudomonadota bacterium]